MGQRRNQKEIKKYLETNKTENTTYQNAAKAVIREKFLIINAYIKKKEEAGISGKDSRVSKLCACLLS